MQSDIFTIIGILIGISVAGAGIFYWKKEKDDRDSVKIYSIVTMIGLFLTIGLAIKIGVLGL